jgi:CRISPR-associated protein Csb2
MHLALDPMPPLARVVEVTDALRSAALARLGRARVDSALAGKTRDGEAMRDGRHAHAHWLPVAGGRDIAGICLWTPAGLSPAETAAVAGVRRIGASTRVILLPGSRPVPAWLAGPALAWESLTPLVPPLRRPRAVHRTPEFFRAMVVAELAVRGLPEPVTAEELGRASGWAVSRPSRPGPGPPPVGLRLEFAEPVTGPLAIGRLSHFGLGVMVPAA